MFDDITEPSLQGGLKGFVARHFGPVTHADVALDEAKDIATIFTVLASAMALLLVLRFAYSTRRSQ